MVDAQADIDAGVDLLAHLDLQFAHLVDLLFDGSIFAQQLLVQLGQPAQLAGMIQQHLAALFGGSMEEVADPHRTQAGNAYALQQLGHMPRPLLQEPFQAVQFFSLFHGHPHRHAGAQLQRGQGAFARAGHALIDAPKVQTWPPTAVRAPEPRPEIITRLTARSRP